MRWMHGLFKLNMQWNAKIKRKLLIKSMSKTISPLLIILTMTHMMEFVSSAASDFVTWDVIWILVTVTFFSILQKVREYIWLYKPVRCQGSNVDGSWMFRHPGILQCVFFSCGSSPKGQNDIYCPVLFHNSTEQG
jgi:hypothetical protein